MVMHSMFKPGMGRRMSFYSTLIMFGVLFAIVAPPSSLAQVATGIPPFSSVSAGPGDDVDLGNLNVHIAIPIINKPGRGLPIVANADIESSIWAPLGNMYSKQWWISGGGAGMDVMGTVMATSGGQGTCTVAGQQYYYNYFSGWTWEDPWGVDHSFLGLTIQRPSTYCYVYPTSMSTTALDGSGYYIQVTATASDLQATVRSRSGLTYNPWVLGGLSTNFTLIDTNGNRINAAPSGVGGTHTPTYTDTLNLNALTESTDSLTAPTYFKYTYVTPSGGTAPVTETLTPVQLATNFQCSNITEYSQPAYLVTQITLPDQTSYQITYESTPGGTSGRIASITFPTGGEITYQYTGANDGINCSDGSTMGLTRTTPDGTWTYVRAAIAGTPQYTTTITDPQNHVTFVTFEGQYEIERQVYEGSKSPSNLLRTTYTCYNGAAFPCSTYSGSNSPIGDVIQQRTVYTLWPNGLESETNTFYDYNSSTLISLGMVIEVDEYGYGNGAPGGLVRKTVTNYNTLLTNGIYDRPAQVIVYNGSGAVQAQTTYTYDYGTPTGTGAPQHVAISGSRGNPTTVSSGGLSNTFTYFDTGTVNVSKDPNLNPTTYAYGACGNAFATSITLSLSLSTSQTWNCNGAVMTSQTDVNNNQTTQFDYTDPYFWRVTEVDYPDGGKTTTAYTDTQGAFSVATSALLKSGVNHEITQLLDGLGRVYQSQDNSASTYVDTTYDSLGRVASVSNPYYKKSDPSYGVTSYSYDALNRLEGSAAITRPDGNTVGITYPANCATSTDETSKVRNTCMDALGRITSVTEDPSGLNYQTTYSYDALNDLTGVTQGSETRSYQYDMLSRLTQVATPESQQNWRYYYYTTSGGAPCSGSPSAVCRRTDERGITTTYTYDALNRLLTKSYSDGTPTANFEYDETSWAGLLNLNNTAGRLSHTWTSTANGYVNSIYSYDPVGRVADYWQCTPYNCGGAGGAGAAPWDLHYNYDLAGDVTSWTHPAGFTITNTVSSAQRITEITSSLSDSKDPPVLAQNIAYTAWGALSTLQNGCVGSGCTQTQETYAYNNRLQPTQIQLGTSSNSAAYYSLAYNYSWPSGQQMPQGCSLTSQSSGNNGNVVGYTYTDSEYSSLSHTALYVYDTVNRLACAQATGNSTYNLDFSYDPYGNMTCVINGSTNGYCPQYSYANSPQTNRITSSGFTYDAAGDVTGDGTRTIQ